MVQVTHPGFGDSERDHTRVGGGERTIGAGSISIVAKGDGENSSLGDA